MNGPFERAIELHRRGDVAGARIAARKAVESRPRDSAPLLFLGLLESREGKLSAARNWLEQAVAAGDGGPAVVALARVLARQEDWRSLARMDRPVPPGAAGDEYLSLRIAALDAIGEKAAAAEALLTLAARRPDDVDVAVAAARSLADAGRLSDAEGRYRAVLSNHPAHPLALLGLTGLLESLSRSADLMPAFEAARAAGADDALVALGTAIECRDAGRFADALNALQATEGLLPQGTFQQMLGEIADRAGNAERAMAAFDAMNRADAADEPQADSGVRQFRDMVMEEKAALSTPAAAAPVEADRRPPVFLLGFPRSGTTLIDTFLMGHPDAQVHEERPFLDGAAALVRPGSRTSMTASDYAALRSEYWRLLDADGGDSGRLQVDKYPLASARAPLIHSMFPDAPYLFAMRHPCDVILSCYMTRFRLNWGVASFLSLKDAAETYDLVMGLWTAAREQLGLRVFDVRYEELVADPAAVIGAAAQFVGLSLDDGLADHRRTAAGRGMIPTPSHAQVTQPLYSRSVGRWVRYRDWLEPVLPLIEPWCDRFGYRI